MSLSIASTNEQKVKVTAAPTTATGKPTTIDGALTVAVVSGNATFTQDPADPLSFFAVSADNDAGQTVFAVSADADLGAGVVTITDQVTYDVSAAQASGFGFTSSPPEPK